jgi:hypothetical protein
MTKTIILLEKIFMALAFLSAGLGIKVCYEEGLDYRWPLVCMLWIVSAFIKTVYIERLEKETSNSRPNI